MARIVATTRPPDQCPGLDTPTRSSVQPVLLLELARQVLLGQILEVLVGQGVQLVLEAAAEHALDLVLPGLLLEPAVLEELLGPAHVLVVELDPDRYGLPRNVGIKLESPMNLALGMAMRSLSKARLIEPCLTTE